MNNDDQPLWTHYAGTVTNIKKHGVVISARATVVSQGKNNHQSFAVRKYGSIEKAREVAEKWRQDKSNELGLTEIYRMPAQLTQEQKEFIAGFFDGDGNVYVKECGVFQLRISQSQKDGVPGIINWFQSIFPGGTLKLSKKQAPQRDAYELCFTGKSALSLLHIVNTCGILKAPQAQLIWNKVYETQRITQPTLYDPERQMKLDYTNIPIDINRLTVAYLAGFFEAEGSVTSEKSRNFRLEISQDGCPRILQAISDKFGNSSVDGTKSVIFSTNFSVTLAEQFLPLLQGTKKEQCQLGIHLRRNYTLQKRQRTKEMETEIDDIRQKIKRLKKK